MKKIIQLNWLKWLPIVGNTFFLLLFLIKLNDYLSDKYLTNRDGWYDFFANDVELALVVSAICSFFIKNKKLKWVSVITGVVIFAILYRYVRLLNPYYPYLKP